MRQRNGLLARMVGEGRSLTEGAVTLLTLVFWSYAVDWLACRFPRVSLAHPVSAARGDPGRQAAGRDLRRDMITEDDLRAQLRLAGIYDMRAIRCAAIESNGELSVRLRDTES